MAPRYLARTLTLAMLAFACAATPQGGKDAREVEEPIAKLRAALAPYDAELVPYDDEAVAASAAALAAMGEDAAAAIPWLWYALEVTPRNSGDKAPRALVVALQAIGRRACLRLPDAGRWLAWEAWIPQPPLAQSPAELLELTEHPVEELRALAARELAREHPAMVTSVLARLAAADPVTRRHAAEALGAFRDSAHRVVAPLTACLSADDPLLRVRACLALGELLPDSALALLEASGHADARVRRQALHGLELGLDARWGASPVPDLDLDGYSCGWTADWALADSGLLSAASLDVLASRLDDPDPWNRILVLMLFTKLGVATRTGIERMEAARSDSHPGVRAWAEHALRRLDASPARAIDDLLVGPDALRPATRPRDERLAELVQVLRTGPEFEPVWGFIGSEFPATGPADPRYEAALELARRAPAAHPTLVLEVVERHVRTLIAVAIASVPLDSLAGEHLCAVGPIALRQVGAAWFVGSWDLHGILNEGATFDGMGEVLVCLGRRSLPLLCLGLENPEAFMETAALLARIPGAAEVAGPALVATLRFPRTQSYHRWWAEDWDSPPRDLRANLAGRDRLELLCQRLGPELTPWLLEALVDERALVRARACRALGALEVASAPVVGALTLALSDGQGQVRFAAARALLRLQSIDPNLVKRCRALLAQLGERP